MPKPIFYTVDFVDTKTGQQYFRLMDSSLDITHKQRMEDFQKELHADHRIEAYEIAMMPEELDDLGISEYNFHTTYWSRALQGAV
tara:strand:- start:204 stop:458 length:255 start_codon:yes stop_codon:yes gene_type:complete